MAEYKQRDSSKLEPHYCKHVGAMTAENLHNKSDIAAELAGRDIEIETLRVKVLRLERVLQEISMASFTALQ